LLSAAACGLIALVLFPSLVRLENPPHSPIPAAAGSRAVTDGRTTPLEPAEKEVADDGLEARAEASPGPDAPEASSADQELPPDPHAKYELAPITEPERENWIREHRWDYFLGNKDAIESTLKKLESAKTREEIYQEAKFLCQVNIATILGMRGREKYMESGVHYSPRPSQEGNYVFQLNYWLYEFHGSEFPEFEVFGLTEKYRDKETKVVNYPDVDPDLFNLMMRRSADALGYF